MESFQGCDVEMFAGEVGGNTQDFGVLSYSWVLHVFEVLVVGNICVMAKTVRFMMPMDDILQWKIFTDLRSLGTTVRVSWLALMTN